MNNQQKQLQSILAEVGINLTENQALAVMEANELLRCEDPSYSQIMEFKGKYAPKREKQDGVNIKQLDQEGINKISAAYDNLASTYQRGLSQQDR